MSLGSRKSRESLSIRPHWGQSIPAYSLYGDGLSTHGAIVTLCALIAEGSFCGVSLDSRLSRATSQATVSTLAEIKGTEYRSL
jgi:hypothetical protein